MYRNILFLLLTSFFSSVAFADQIECTKDQSKCNIRNNDLTMDDKVVFLNSDNEVVAIGEVTRLQQDRRYLKIIKRFGRISSKDSVRLMDSKVQRIEEIKRYYKVYVAKPKYIVGGSLGFATFNVGEFLSGYEITGFGQKKINEIADYVGRVGLTLANGKITKDNIGIEQDAMELTALTIMPGIAGTVFRKYNASVRMEFDLGMSWISATVDGTADNVLGAGYNSKVENGLGLAARLEGSIQFDLSETTELGAFVGVSRIFNAQGTVIGVSMSMRLD